MILIVMEDIVPQNPNPSRLKLTPVTLARLVEIKRLETKMENLSDEELRRRTDEMRDRLLVGKGGGQSVIADGISARLEAKKHSGFSAYPAQCRWIPARRSAGSC